MKSIGLKQFTHHSNETNPHPIDPVCPAILLPMPLRQDRHGKGQAGENQGGGVATGGAERMTENKYFYMNAEQVPIYGGMLVIMITNDMKRIKKYLPEFNPNELFAHACFDNFRGMQGFFVILNPSNMNGVISPGVVAHEATHISSYIAKERGFVADFDNDEPIAYLVQYVADRAWDYLQLIKPKLDKPTEKE